MNKKTIALTAEQYKTIIATMKQGFSGCRPNERIATALILEANLGLRISDIVELRLADIVHDGDRYRLSIVEQKTKKARTFTVPLALYQFIRCYCLDHNIAPEARIFPITERAVQKRLQSVCFSFKTLSSLMISGSIPNSRLFPFLVLSRNTPLSGE